VRRDAGGGRIYSDGRGHIFNIKRLQPIVRPTILTAFLGYVLVCVALMYDLGRPYRIWHPLIMRNPHSVMFEVAYCVMLYTTVLSLEFSPIVLERFNLQKPLKIVRGALIPLVILGVILSTLHQSSLGTLYLIMPEKLHPLWYSPLLPVFFFISAIAVGLAMTIFESSLSAMYFGRQLELPILQELGRVLVVVLSVYGILRFEDLLHRGVLKLLSQPGYEMYLFWLEISLSLVLPLLLLSQKKIRASAQGLYLAAVLVVLGFITNRLNVSITGLESAAGMHYVPKWMEIAVTGAIIAAGFALFGLAAHAEPDTRGSKVLGELSVHRESLERVLRENPESLTSILTALISALETHRNPIGATDEEPEEDGVYALTEV
jgi:Ni/Fe-hydrogenase subunit HybB-like protein